MNPVKRLYPPPGQILSCKASTPGSASTPPAIPALAIADSNTLGGVKSAADVVNGEVTSVATNKVYVDATSAVGEVKAISTDILVNGSEELILFGGNATVNA